jgi:hypothetical protein
VYAPYGENWNQPIPASLPSSKRPLKPIYFNFRLIQLQSLVVILMPLLASAAIPMMLTLMVPMASRTPTVLVRNSLTWHATAAYKQALPTSNTTVTKHSMTSRMIMPLTA